MDIRKLLGACVLGFGISSAVFAATLPDATISRVTVEKAALRADGIDNTIVTVTVKDSNLTAMQDKVVTLASSRGAADRIRPIGTATDLLGKMRFRVDSLKNGTSIFTALVDGVQLTETVSITFSGGLSFAISPGELIKIPDDGNAKTLNDTAVYYYAVDGRRYVFPNEKVYFTWFPDFSKVKVIPLDQMALIPLASNITYRPGSKMVKFQTDPKTYLVTKSGVLRWAKTEQVARDWFGPEWNTNVDDISESFYVNYTFGQPVENAYDLPLDIARSTVNSIDADKGLVSAY